jgi:hypothetical protein
MHVARRFAAMWSAEAGLHSRLYFLAKSPAMAGNFSYQNSPLDRLLDSEFSMGIPRYRGDNLSISTIWEQTNSATLETASELICTPVGWDLLG